MASCTLILLGDNLFYVYSSQASQPFCNLSSPHAFHAHHIRRADYQIAEQDESTLYRESLKYTVSELMKGISEPPNAVVHQLRPVQYAEAVKCQLCFRGNLSHCSFHASGRALTFRRAESVQFLFQSLIGIITEQFVEKLCSTSDILVTFADARM